MGNVVPSSDYPNGLACAHEGMVGWRLDAAEKDINRRTCKSHKEVDGLDSARKAVASEMAQTRLRAEPEPRGPNEAARAGSDQAGE